MKLSSLVGRLAQWLADGKDPDVTIGVEHIDHLGNRIMRSSAAPALILDPEKNTMMIFGRRSVPIVVSRAVEVGKRDTEMRNVVSSIAEITEAVNRAPAKKVTRKRAAKKAVKKAAKKAKAKRKSK